MKPGWMAWPWRGLLLIGLLSILIPVDQDSAALVPTFIDSGLGYPSALSKQLYIFIKSAMLWVPLGALLGFAGYARVLKAWGPMGVIGAFLFVMPVLSDPRAKDLLEILFAVPGLTLGLWLGSGTWRYGVSVEGPAAREVPGQISIPAHEQQDTESPLSWAPPGPQGDTSADEQNRKTSFSRNHRGASRQAASVRPLGLVMGLGLVALAFFGTMDFPRWPVVLGMCLAVYAVLLWYRPLSWLIVVPISLPLLDLAPWTGRFYIDEFDLLMLLTAGMLVLRGHRSKSASRLSVAFFLMALFALAASVSLVLGLQGLPPLDANAYVSYWSQWNSLRVAKGLLWGALFYRWFLRTPGNREAATKWLSMGMILGVSGVSLVGLWEHALFVGAQDGHETYRIFSTFSSMHTGGGHIEAYLVAALPFLWLATTRLRHLALTAPVMLAVAYVMLYTVARGGVLAIGVVITILAMASLRLAPQARAARVAVPLGVLALLGAVLAAGVGEGYFQARFSQTGKDWQTRLDHWEQALAMRDDSLVTQLFGMGLGSFPRTFRDQGPVDGQPASFGFASEKGNRYFRLGTGETIYFAQRIPFVSGLAYQLELDVRSSAGATRLDTPVCEKQLLNSRQCEWLSFDIPGDSQWHKVKSIVGRGKVGAGSWWQRPPVELSLYNPGKRGVVDVDNVRLVDAGGKDVLCNGNFSRGEDCWFFKTHSHLPWHIKNLWVHVLFEQGWIGLLLFSALVATAIYRLARAGWRGHRLAWAWLASLAGLLTVGMFDSLLDAPRLAALLVAWTLLGAGYQWEPGRRGHRARA